LNVVSLMFKTSVIKIEKAQCGIVAFLASFTPGMTRYCVFLCDLEQLWMMSSS
jgi:hypothetical protein